MNIDTPTARGGGILASPLRLDGKLTQANGIPPDKVDATPAVTIDPFGRLWVWYGGSELYRLDLSMKERRKARAVFERV